VTRVVVEKKFQLPIAHRSGFPYSLLDIAFPFPDRTTRGLFL